MNALRKLIPILTLALVFSVNQAKVDVVYAGSEKQKEEKEKEKEKEEDKNEEKKVKEVKEEKEEKNKEEKEKEEKDKKEVVAYLKEKEDKETGNIPEPSVLLLIGSGLVGLGLASRRKS